MSAAWEAPDALDAARLRYIAEYPETLRFLYDLFGETQLKPGHDPLTAMRDVLDAQMEDFPNGVDGA